MSLGLLLLFGHITAMVSAVTIAYGPGLLLELATRTGQPGLIRGVVLATKPVEPFIPVLFVTGGVLGLATALNFGTNLLAPWLVIAYALWLVAMVTGAGIHAPYHRRLEKLFSTAPEGSMSPELVAAIADPRERLAATLDYVIVVSILFDMVVKPFS